ncbi:hypothetical protein [Nocardiopsis rhodophaea]|uniref:hypothetical protein n=1 Tax=Nocardiopsis rhodophaea TaxID=280238 RepID=UPI0031D2891C
MTDLALARLREAAIQAVRHQEDGTPKAAALRQDAVIQLVRCLEDAFPVDKQTTQEFAAAPTSNHSPNRRDPNVVRACLEVVPE